MRKGEVSGDLRNRNLNEISYLDCFERFFNLRQKGSDNRHLVARQEDNGELYSGKVLLMTQVLIGCDKDVELLLCKLEQFTVLDTAPVHFLDGANRQVRKALFHNAGRAFIKQDVHRRGAIAATCFWRTPRPEVLDRGLLLENCRETHRE